MARLNTGDKTQRVLVLLSGFANRRVRRALKAYGLDIEEINRGWLLLRRACESRLDPQELELLESPVVIRLDAWENLWFPIVAATLQGRFPAIFARVFANLVQSEGVEVIVTVGTLLNRLEQIASDPEGKRALELLAKRGVTAEVLAEARGMLEELKTPPEIIPEPEPQDPEQAVAELWSWYLEWSTIARQVITDYKLLRAMGFLKPQRRGEEDEEVPELPAPVAAPVATPATPVAPPATPVATPAGSAAA